MSNSSTEIPKCEKAATPFKVTASELITQWPADKTFDANLILKQHPDLRRHKSIVIDLAYEEYCRRVENKEILSPEAFVEQFQEIQHSLACLIEVHKFLNANPDIITDVSNLNWPQVGEKFLNLDLVEELGQGAFSRVFLAKEENLGDREVVAKICAFGDYEAEILGKLNHQNIVPVYSVQTDHETGLTAICMPYFGRATLLDVLDGITAEKTLPVNTESLLALISNETDKEHNASSGADHNTPLRSAWKSSYTDTVLDIGVQLAEALEFSHQHHICHGDMKPSNVLVNSNGQVMLLDFNLSFQKEKEKERKGGTLPYMSPEQLVRILKEHSGDEHDIDEQSDLFGLGIVLYELFTGKHPFEFSLATVSRKQAAEELIEKQQRPFQPLQVLNSHLDSGIETTIKKCLAFQPEERWQSATELKKSLREALSFKRRAIRWIKGHKKISTAICLSFILLLSAVGYAIGSREPLEVRLMNEALLAYHQGHFDDSARTCQQLVDLNPDLYEARYYLGRSLMQSETLTIHKLEEAFNCFEYCERQSEDDVRVTASKAYVRTLIGNTTDLIQNKERSFLAANSEYEKVSGKLPGSQAIIENNRGYCHLQLKNFGEAEAHFLKAIDWDNHLEQAHFNLAVLNLKLAMPKREIAFDSSYIEKFLELNRNVPVAYRHALFIYAGLCRDTRDDQLRAKYLKKFLDCSKKIADGSISLVELKSLGLIYSPLKENAEYQKMIESGRTSSDSIAQEYLPFKDPVVDR